jgi:hypothetical protein
MLGTSLLTRGDINASVITGSERTTACELLTGSTATGDCKTVLEDLKPYTSPQARSVVSGTPSPSPTAPISCPLSIVLEPPPSKLRPLITTAKITTTLVPQPITTPCPASIPIEPAPSKLRPLVRTGAKTFQQPTTTVVPSKPSNSSQAFDPYLKPSIKSTVRTRSRG